MDISSKEELLLGVEAQLIDKAKHLFDLHIQNGVQWLAHEVVRLKKDKNIFSPAPKNPYYCVSYVAADLPKEYFEEAISKLRAKGFRISQYGASDSDISFGPFVIHWE